MQIMSSLGPCGSCTRSGAIQCYVTLFVWILDPHPPPRNANNVEPYTFVTLFPGKVDTPHPHLHYVKLEWPLTYRVGERRVNFVKYDSADLLYPEDGMRKLRQMEMTTGVWTMQVTMQVESRDLVIVDRQTEVSLSYK